MIGFYERSIRLVQLIHPHISDDALVSALPNGGELFTYNGHCFDLPIIRKRLGVNLREVYQSVDLRFVCQRVGLTGGLKAVERTLGFQRKHPEISGWDASRLWGPR